MDTDLSFRHGSNQFSFRDTRSIVEQGLVFRPRTNQFGRRPWAIPLRVTLAESWSIGLTLRFSLFPNTR